MPTGGFYGLELRWFPRNPYMLRLLGIGTEIEPETGRPTEVISRLIDRRG